jgi:hypothetical protein
MNNIINEYLTSARNFYIAQDVELSAVKMKWPLAQFCVALGFDCSSFEVATMLSAQHKHNRTAMQRKICDSHSIA